MAYSWSAALMRHMHTDLCHWLGAGILPHYGWVIGIHVLAAMAEKRSLDIQVNWADFWENAVTLDDKPYAPKLAKVVESYPVGIPDELQQYVGLLFDTCPLRLAQKKELAREHLDDNRQLQALFLEADMEDHTSVIDVPDLTLYVAYVPDIAYDPLSVDHNIGVKSVLNLKGF